MAGNEELDTPIMRAFAERVKKCCGARVYIDRVGCIATTCQHFRKLDK